MCNARERERKRGGISSSPEPIGIPLAIDYRFNPSRTASGARNRMKLCWASTMASPRNYQSAKSSPSSLSLLYKQNGRKKEGGGTTSVVQTWCRVCMTGRSSSATSLDFFFFFNWFFSSLHPSCCCCCSTESGRSREPAHTQRALMSWSESLDWSTSRAG